MIVSLLATIPRPSSGAIHIFGLSIHAYGLMIALGVVAGVWLAGRRMEAAGVGTRDDMSSIAVWAVAAGVLGARLYYIVTDKSQPWKEPSRWLQVWKGGLGIPGGLLFGIVVALWAAKRHDAEVAAGIPPAKRGSGLVAEVALAKSHGIPVVLVGGTPDDAHFPHRVIVDQVLGGRLATRHLIDRGCTSIAHVSGPEGWFDADCRVLGWRAALAAPRQSAPVRSSSQSPAR